ncbi:cytochrome c [Desulfonatronum sp. SC1]|uniref:cytochrome c n=1 Tax=Desulfonatronum sp. SC1 TaxID=2109626 RepID=UPI000D301BCD|nr:cytochrome c [Desulfonatronum sp. SC1]PTN31467.1 hypothetical protein C6366_18100 [Desulfonatronum sp. SC1]
MKKRFFILALGGVLMLAGTQAISKEKHEAENLVNTQCSRCHTLERIEIARTMKDRKAWEKTVDAMIAKKPGLLDADQRDAVVNFLVQD